MKFKAAVLTELAQPLAIEELECPPLRFGQVLVKVHRSGICGSQLGEIDGAKGSDPYLPHLLGHEGSGIVVEIGDGVRTVRPDDHVVLHWRPGSGLQGEPPIYKSSSLGKVNAGWVTTFNEFSVVSENRVTTIPRDFDLDLAVLFGCAVTTGFGVVNRDADIKIGESVLVYGAGGIGLNIVQAAAMVSAHPIIAVDRYQNRLDLAKQMGATHLVCANDVTTAQRAIREITNGGDLDVCIDNTGQPAIIECCYDLTAAKGRTILVGVPRHGRKATIYTLPLHFDKKITGSHGGDAKPDIDIPNYIKLVKCNKLNGLGLLKGEVYDLADINLAIDHMRTGVSAARVLISF